MEQTQKQMMNSFIDIITKSDKTSHHFTKAAECLEEIGCDTDIIWEQHCRYTDEYLQKLVEVFEVNRISDLIAEEWFWAEWTASERCFMFVYGYTAHVREETRVQKFNDERRQEELAIAEAEAEAAANCLAKARKLILEGGLDEDN